MTAEAGEGPAIILVEPQLGENIGAVARAMLNCGLTDLRLVKPRDGWPSIPAERAAAGADIVLERTGLFDSVTEAIADLTLVYATTARSRDMMKPVLAPTEAVERLVAAEGRGEKVGVMFGRERSGLTNDDLALADAAVTFPLNPDFTSLNLAQAVLLVGWEWRKLSAEAPPAETMPAISSPATHGDLSHLFDHLERELDAGGFFFPPDNRPIMVRNLRTLLTRAQLTEQDVRTFHGVIRCLAEKRNRQT
ncbi:MAG TPA: RNA methyltransferase [Aliidongia sp.]|nr:RNA methyltransferase [Aliidongia sp.]